MSDQYYVARIDWDQCFRRSEMEGWEYDYGRGVYMWIRKPPRTGSGLLSKLNEALGKWISGAEIKYIGMVWEMPFRKRIDSEWKRERVGALWEEDYGDEEPWLRRGVIERGSRP